MTSQQQLAEQLAFIDFTFSNILAQLCDVIVDGDVQTKQYAVQLLNEMQTATNPMSLNWFKSLVDSIDQPILKKQGTNQPPKLYLSKHSREILHDPYFNYDRKNIKPAQAFLMTNLVEQVAVAGSLECKQKTKEEIELERQQQDEFQCTTLEFKVYPNYHQCIRNITTKQMIPISRVYVCNKNQHVYPENVACQACAQAPTTAVDVRE